MEPITLVVLFHTKLEQPNCYKWLHANAKRPTGLSFHLDVLFVIRSASNSANTSDRAPAGPLLLPEEMRWLSFKRRWLD